MRRLPAIAAAILAAGVVLAAGTIGSRGSTQIAARSPFDPEWVRKWAAAASAHQPGQVDAPLRLVAAWSSPLLDGTLQDAVLLARAMRDLLQDDPNSQKRVKVPPNYSFSLDDLRLIFGLPLGADATRVLQRGVLLHTDVAILDGGSAGGGSGAVQVSDGQVVAGASLSAHWDCARDLLDGLPAEPSVVETRRQWYYAASAYFAGTARWSDALPHLEHALRIFPTDARIAFHAGVMHEVFASAGVQSAVHEAALRRAATLKAFGGAFVGGRSQIETAPVELARAEKLLLQAVALDANLAEARLHLGHVVGLLGRHDEAGNQLAAALTAVGEPVLEYYAALFLAQAQASSGKRDEARRNLERAAALYPTAQAPLLALSQLARQAGDSPAAREPFDRLMRLPADIDTREDPWWTYDRTHGRDADRRLADVRRLLAKESLK